MDFIFIPAAGQCNYEQKWSVGSSIYCWASNVSKDIWQGVYYLYGDRNGSEVAKQDENMDLRFNGYTVRAVYKS